MGDFGAAIVFEKDKVNVAEPQGPRRLEELSDFVENATVALHQAGPDGTILWVNQAELALLGYTREEYVGHSIVDFHADRTVIDDILARLKNHEEIKAYRARMLAKDGTIRHVSINSSGCWENGCFAHSRCFTYDITDHKRSEARLASEHAVTRILSTARDLEEAAPKILEAIMTSLEVDLGELWLLDPQQTALQCLFMARKPEQVSDHFENDSRRMTFAQGVGLPGRVWQTRQPAWIAELSVDPGFLRARQAVAEGLRAGFATPLHTGDSFFGVMAFYGSTRMQPDEPLLSMMAAIGSEIGQFIQSRRAARELEAAHSFRNAVEASMAAGIAAYDLEGRQTYVNPAFCRMLGWTEAELVGEMPPYRYWPAGELDAIRAAFRQTLEGKAPAAGVALRFQRRNGEQFDALMAVSPLTGSQQSAIGWLASFTDISEQKRTEESLKLLAVAGDVLASSLDYRSTLNRLARLTIEQLADWCAIDILEGDDLHRLVVDHRDPRKLEAAERFRQEYPPDAYPHYGPRAVVRSGKSEYLSEITDEIIESSNRAPGFVDTIRLLGLKSYICCPIAARGRILGALTLVSAESGRRYDEKDLRIAEEIARRAGIALDNATLYESAQQQLAERERVERALRESEERLQSAMDAARMGAWQWEIQTGQVIWSSTLERIHCRRPGSFQGTFESVLEDFHPDDIAGFQQTVADALENRRDLHVEYRIVTPEGPIRFLEAHGKLELAAGQPLRLRGTCMDITARKMAEQASRDAASSRALAAGLLRGQEEERRRLARELHDDFTQQVAVLTIEVDRLKEQLAAVPHSQGGLDRIRERLLQVSDGMRRLSHQLHPPLLEYLGLGGAVRAECDTMKEAQGIQVDFLASPDLPDDIPRDISLALYRVVQEALQNISKHANTSRATLSLEYFSSEIRLRIQDQGAGFNPDEVRAAQGLGLISMQERVRALGGTFEVQSRPGAGTALTVIVPLSSPAANADSFATAAF